MAISPDARNAAIRANKPAAINAPATISITPVSYTHLDVYKRQTHLATGAGALKYDGQRFFNGGLAATYMGFTINADVTHGRLNGSNALDPTGGVPMQAELGSISYAVGPFSVGVLGGIEDSQGTAQLVGISQRHEVALAVGGAYRIAPGINLCLEYQYVQKHQGDVNLSSGNIGPATAATIGASGSAGNDIHLNGLTFATIVNW